MSRPRTIDQDDVLSAAEVVASRDGAANLTLDAVATEAGISKASVIYDYGSKQCLIRAVIERRLRIEQERVQQAITSLRSEPNAEIRGRIAVMAEGPTSCEDGASAAMNLCLLLSQDQDLQRLMQGFQRGQIEAVLRDAKSPRESIIAFLALEGLKGIEYFGFYEWPPEERAGILEDIAALVRSKPS